MDDSVSVTFEHFAFVTAALSDGIPLAEVLEHQSLDPAAWQRAEPYWHQQIAATMNDDEPLFFQLDALQREAREQWQRPLPPLDEDLGSWLDFMRTLDRYDDPIGYLDELGITAADLGALARLWTQRLEGELALREQLESIVARPPAQVVVPRVERPVLKKNASEPEDAAGTGFFSSFDFGEGSALPFEPAKKAPVRFAPALSTPLPKPKVGDLDATGSLDSGALFDLPFNEAPEPPSPKASVDPPPPPSPVAAPAAPPRAPVAPMPPLEPGPTTAETPSPPAGANETAFAFRAVDVDDALPFDPSAPGAAERSASEGATADLEEPHPAAGETSFSFTAIDVEEEASAALTIEQYAAVRVELEMQPDQAATLLARYGIDHEGLRQLDATYQRQCQQRPDLQQRYQQAYAAYRRWREHGSRE